MKKTNCLLSSTVVFFAVALSFSGVFLSGCDLLLGKPEERGLFSPEGTGILSVSFLGTEAETPAARTMLASNPEFTRYELYVSPDPGTGAGSKTYPSSAASFQLTLPNGTYTLSGAGFTGDKLNAKTWDLASRSVVTYSVTIGNGIQVEKSLKLSPYMDPAIYGTLRYSLNWDTVGQIPARAELLIERYNDNGTPDYFDDDAWEPIPISLIGENVTAGAQQGTVILLQRTTGLVQQSGALDLPPGEYRLTTTAAMDGPYPPVSRTDIAHVFSNLTTPAAFFYGSGDLTVTSAGLDTGSGFITRFNFTETPGAVSIIGSNPGPDGTRLIMVMVPADTNLTNLTPVVECAPGARIISPAPSLGPAGSPFWPSGDYSRPTFWTAEGRNGVTQQYTVVVTEQAADDCLITGIAFDDVELVSDPVIDHASRSITVMAPSGTRAGNPNYELKPVISFIGDTAIGIKLVDPDYLDDPSHDIPFTQGAPLEFVEDGIPARIFRIYAQNGGSKTYAVMILEAASSDAEITGFFFDGYPDYPGKITQPAGNPPVGGSIIVEGLPYGTPLTGLKPLIIYKGKLSPGSGVEQNFSVPGGISYTVSSWDGTITKTYPVTVTTKSVDSDTGIYDFVIVNVPRAKVVIGTRPRADGKIPIIVSVPYATSPLITPTPVDGPKTNLRELIPRITLSSKTSKFIDPKASDPSTAAEYDDPSPINGSYIPFGNQDDYQEAVYRVKAQAGNTQDYVVVAARDVQYYYVKASGDDRDPDQYNGGSESTPFKTLAYAVYQAVKHNVDHIFVIGTLSDSSEGGAWEDTATITVGNNGTFNPSGAPSVSGGASVFNLKGAGLDGTKPWPIYITGTGSNAVLQGAADKRVISVTGGAHITFDNITVRGGGGASYAGNGGGVYVGGGSTVIWKSGAVTGNRARSGGGVYVDNSEFDLITGSVSSNTATGSTAANPARNGPAADIAGGGGIYINGDGLFWLANGEVFDNGTAGSGGGVMVNGSAIPARPTQENLPHNFIMSGGSVNHNTSTGSSWPHGGGGVYVAKGAFEMLNGQVMYNKSARQGGGVFVWSRSLFVMDGDSSITNNDGVGSSKAICNRGITRMQGKAQADKVYIWNYAKGNWNNGNGDEFTMMAGARVSGLVLAFADDPKDNRNYINIMQSGTQFFTPGTDHISTIDLESHLTNAGTFAVDATLEGDWLGHHLIKNGNGNAIPPDLIKRFSLNTFISGGATKSLSHFKLDTTGKLAK
jgi:hypothetical protein